MIKLVLMFMMFFSSDKSVAETKIHFQVKGIAGGNPVQIIMGDSVYQQTVDSANRAVFVMGKDLQPGYAAISYNRAWFPIYIEPGKNWEVVMEFTDKRFKVDFTGEEISKNEYLNSNVFKEYMPDFKLNESDFIACLEARLEELYQNLASYDFEPEFVRIEKKRLFYSVYMVLMAYPGSHAYFADAPGYKPASFFYDKLQSLLEEEEELLGMREYQVVLSCIVRNMVLKDYSTTDRWKIVERQIEYIEKHIKSELLAEFLVNKIFYEYVEMYGILHLAEIRPVFEAKVKNPKKKADFNKLCQKWQAMITKGAPSPDFKYFDINDKEIGLSDLRGKYVYIDLWATWCPSCVEEMPALQKLRKEFEGKNIYFVSISQDEDKVAWRKMVREKNWGGIQLHAGSDKSFSEAYVIVGIPRFILLDKEGKIINAYMSAPSASQTRDMLINLEGL